MRNILFAWWLCVPAFALADEPNAPPSAQTALPAQAVPSTQTAPSAQTSPSAAAIARAATSAVAAASAAAVPAAPSCLQLKAFKDRLHKAIDAALKYPADLRFQAVVGVTIVAYDYQEGQVSYVHITQGSGDGRLDRAAVNAVKNADYEAITPGIGGRRLHDSVIIIYDNSNSAGGRNAAQRPHQDDVMDKECDS